MKTKASNAGSGRTGAALMACAVCLAMGAPATALQAQQPPGMGERVVQIVNDRPITTYDVRQRVLWLLMSMEIEATPENLRQLEAEATQALVDEALQMAELAKQEQLRKLAPGTFSATDAQIDSYINDVLAPQNGMTGPQLMQELNRAGIHTRPLREQLRAMISWQQWTRNFFQRRIRITDEQIDAVMNNIIAQASQPAYLISEIFLSSERPGGMEATLAQANQILAQIRQQGRFEPLARQYSVLPTGARGGDTGWMTSGEVRPEALPILQQMRPGQVSTPIVLNNGVYIVLLRDKQEGANAAPTLFNLKHVLTPVPAGGDEAAVSAAQARLAGVRSQITGCANLEQVAQAAGLQAGDLGQANINDLTPAFQAAVRELQPNQVSSPVRSEAGLHLVVVCSRAQAAGPDLPTRDQVAQRLYEEQVAMIQRREIRNLRNSAIIMRPQAR